MVAWNVAEPACNSRRSAMLAAAARHRCAIAPFDDSGRGRLREGVGRECEAKPRRRTVSARSCRRPTGQRFEVRFVPGAPAEQRGLETFRSSSSSPESSRVTLAGVACNWLPRPRADHAATARLLREADEGAIEKPSSTPTRQKRRSNPCPSRGRMRSKSVASAGPRSAHLALQALQESPASHARQLLDVSGQMGHGGCSSRTDSAAASIAGSKWSNQGTGPALNSAVGHGDRRGSQPRSSPVPSSCAASAAARSRSPVAYQPALFKARSVSSVAARSSIRFLRRATWLLMPSQSVSRPRKRSRARAATRRHGQSMRPTAFDVKRQFDRRSRLPMLNLRPDLTCSTDDA